MSHGILDYMCDPMLEPTEMESTQVQPREII